MSRDAPAGEAQRRADRAARFARSTSSTAADSAGNAIGLKRSASSTQQKRSIDSLEGCRGLPKTKRSKLLSAPRLAEPSHNALHAASAAAAATASGGGGQGGGPRRVPPSNVLHVRNIPQDATKEGLEADFAAHGLAVVQVRKIYERPQVRSTGL